MTDYSADAILDILHSAAKVEGRAGETRLDALVRDATYDKAVSATISTALSEVADQLHTADEWHALQQVIGQLMLRDGKVGERILARIDGHALAGEAALWAAYSAHGLGATLPSAALLAIEGCRDDFPVQWFALMQQTQAIGGVEAALLKLAEPGRLGSREALDIVRAYRRWATENDVKWNVPLSKFLKALPNDIEREVTAKIARSLGPSFRLSENDEMLPARDVDYVSLYDRQAVQNAMDRIFLVIDQSYQHAVAA